MCAVVNCGLYDYELICWMYESACGKIRGGRIGPLAANDPIAWTAYVPEENDYALIQLNW